MCVCVCVCVCVCLSVCACSLFNTHTPPFVVCTTCYFGACVNPSDYSTSKLSLKRWCVSLEYQEQWTY